MVAGSILSSLLSASVVEEILVWLDVEVECSILILSSSTPICPLLPWRALEPSVLAESGKGTVQSESLGGIWDLNRTKLLGFRRCWVMSAVGSKLGNPLSDDGLWISLRGSHTGLSTQLIFIYTAPLIQSCSPRCFAKEHNNNTINNGKIVKHPLKC